MKHTTQLFLIFMFLISINPCSAIIYESMVDNPLGLGHCSTDIILVSEGTSPSSLYRFDHTDTGSGSTNIVSIPNYIEDAAIGSNGLIYFVLTDGRVYQFSGGAGYYDFSDSDTYNTSFLLLGDLDGNSQDRTIVIDNDGNIYSNSGTEVKIFTHPAFTLASFDTFTYTIYSLALHEDGLLVGTSGATGLVPIVQIYLSQGTSNEMIFTESYTALDVTPQCKIFGIHATDNKDVYYSLYLTSGGWGTEYFKGYIDRLNYSDNYNKTLVHQTYTGGGTTTVDNSAYTPSDLYIDNNGIIYASYEFDDTIKTYSTDGLIGGYSARFYAGATGDIQLEYDTSSIDSLYSSYHNDSNVMLSYAIVIDISECGVLAEFETINEDYYFIVDLLNPDGYLEKQSFITDLTEEGWLYVTSTANAYGTLTYTADVWESGNWTAHLYEYDMNTGLRSLLDSCDFEITNTVSATDVVDITPDVDPNLDPISRTDALLESNAFIGLLIILACISAFGKVGGIVGVVLGTVAGISLATLLGYIPGWIMFVMIMALCIMFTSKIVGQIGGGNE